MKLNYTLDKYKNNDDLKNKTKLSMQSTVNALLAEKQATAPASPVIPQQNGWARTN